MEKQNARLESVPWSYVWLVIGFLLLIVSNGIGPIWAAKESDYERLVKVAFEMTEIAMHKRELRDLE